MNKRDDIITTHGAFLNSAKTTTSMKSLTIHFPQNFRFQNITNICFSARKKKQKVGFTVLRGAGEMEVFFNYAKTEELLRYEAALGRQLSLSVCWLCLYDTHRLDEGQFIEVRKCHGHEIFKDIAWVVT